MSPGIKDYQANAGRIWAAAGITISYIDYSD
jgi:hypothetical protein